MTCSLWQRPMRRWWSGPRKPRGSASEQPPFRPTLEQLETRLVPTAQTLEPPATAGSIVGHPQNNGGLTPALLPASSSSPLGAGAAGLSPATDPTAPGAAQVSTAPTAGGGSAAASPLAPVGPLTGFALGFSPGFALDLFSVDSTGEVFAQSFSLLGVTGPPTFINGSLNVLGEVSGGQVLGFLATSNSSLFYPIDIFENFFNPYVEPVVLDALQTHFTLL